jgi:multiple sugar transport system substrate-binding protein
MWGDVNEIKSVEKSLTQFEKLNPGISLKIIHARGSSEYRRKLQTMIAGGIPPDIMYVEATDFPGFVEKGIFYNLQPLIKKDKDFKVEDYYANLSKIFKYKGNIYGIPKDFATLVLYYNVSMFEKAGVQFPRRDWDWNDLLETSRNLTQDLDGDGKVDQFGIEVDPDISRWAAFLWQNGGKIYEEQTRRWVIASGDYLKANVETFQFLHDLIYKYKVSPSPSLTGEHYLFETGRVGMSLAGRWKCLRYKEIKDFKWDIAELAKGKERASVLFTVCYAISRDCKNPQEAWRVLKFMAGKEGQIETANSGHAIPSLIRIAESDHFLKAGELPLELNHRANLTSVPYARPLPLHPDWLLAQDIIKENIDKIFVNSFGTIEEILKDTEKELKKLK